MNKKSGMLAAALAVWGIATSETQAVEFSGFFDAQANFNTAASEGFVLGNGGLTVRQKSGPWDGCLDFGLKNGVAFDTLRSQAYVQYDSGTFGLMLGQFDSVFRYNPVDSIDRVLVSESLTDSASGLTLFTKLVGARAHVKAGPAKISAFVVDPRNQPILGTGGNLDVAAQVLFDFNTLSLGTGLLYNVDPALGWIWNTNLGVDVGTLRLNAAFIYKNSTTTTAWSAIAEPTFHFSDSVDFSVRGEYLKPTSANTTVQISTGPRFKIEKVFRLKAEYLIQSGTTVALSHGIGLAALAAF